MIRGGLYKFLYGAAPSPPSHKFWRFPKLSTWLYCIVGFVPTIFSWGMKRLEIHQPSPGIISRDAILKNKDLSLEMEMITNLLISKLSPLDIIEPLTTHYILYNRTQNNPQYLVSA